MGLFDLGGFDMNALGDYLNPVNNAALAPSMVDPTAIGNVGGLTPEALRAAGADFPRAPQGGPPIPPPPDINGQIRTDATPAVRSAGIPGNPPQPPAVIQPPAPVPPPAPVIPPGGSTLGAVLTGNNTGVGPTGPTLPGKEGGSTDVSAQAKKPEDRMANLATALKGVQAPKAPEIQKISSPNAPRPTGTIKSGDLQALLLALNAGSAMGGKLPVTLGRG